MKRQKASATWATKSFDADCRALTPVYEVRPRKDKLGVDLISDALGCGRMW